MSPQTGRTTTSYTRYRVAHTVWQISGGHSDRRGVNNYLCRVERMWPCRSTWTRPSCQSGRWSASSRSFSAWWAWSSNRRHHPNNHHHHHHYWKSAASSKLFLVRSLLRAEPGSHELGSGLIIIIIEYHHALLLPFSLSTYDHHNELLTRLSWRSCRTPAQMLRKDMPRWTFYLIICCQNYCHLQIFLGWNLKIWE